MPRGRPVTPNQRARVRELHAEGKSRNDIVRDTGIAAGTVSAIAKGLGLSFEREQVKAATAAKVADSKARRATLAALLLDDAHRLRERLWQPSKQIANGPEGAEIITLDLPPARDTKDFMHAVSGAVKSHVDLEKLDSDTGANDAKSMLGALGDALRLAADGINGTVGE